MELSRRQTLSVFGIAAVAATVPASTAKASTPPVFESLVLNSKLVALVDCPIPVVSVTATIFSRDRTVEFGHYTLALIPGSPPTDGRWEVSVTAGMAIGRYSVDFVAVSADDGVTAETRELAMHQLPSYTMSLSPAAIDDDHRVVTVNGTVVGRHPVTQAVAPIAGLRIQIRALYADPVAGGPENLIVTSAADGTFTGQLTLDGAANVQANNSIDSFTSFVWFGAFGPIHVPVAKRALRLTAGLDNTSITMGESATVSGVVEVQVDGQWRPYAAQTVLVSFVPIGSEGPGEWQQTTSDGEGRYALAVTPRIQGRYLVQVDGDLFHAGLSTYTPSFVVRWPLVFDADHFFLGPSPSGAVGLFHIGGQFLSESPLTYTHLGVEVQFRARPTGAWLTLATTNAESTGSDYRFGTTFTPPASGQVRVFVAATDLYQACSSPAYNVVAPRIPTRPISPDPAPGSLPPQRRL